MNVQEIIHDISRRYSQTFLLVKMPDAEEPVVCWCDRIEATRGKGGGEIFLFSEEYGQLKLNINTSHDLIFRQPRVGVFQHGREAFCYRRVPRRQWQRGLCTGNSSIIPVTASLVPQTYSIFANDPKALPMVQAAFDGETYSVERALEMLRTKKARSVALAEDFSLSLSFSEDPNFVLFYMISPIARISKEGGVVHIYEKIYSKEIRELFHEYS